MYFRGVDSRVKYESKSVGESQVWQVPHYKKKRVRKSDMPKR